MSVWACCCSKLSERQRELILEFAKTEQLDNGTVNGLEQGSLLYLFLECGLEL